MALYVAGQRIRASELNRLPQTYRITNDTTVNTSAAYLNAGAMAFSGEANGIYLLEPFVCYRTGSVPGIKFRWQIPDGVTGWWGAQAVTGSSRIGDFDSSSFLNDFTANFGASGDSILAQVIAQKAVAIYSTIPGTMQLQFAQTTADPSNTTIKSGSVMRVTQLA